MLLKEIKKSLSDLVDLLNQLSDIEYIKPIKVLSESTIGEHTRHIIEMFQCLEDQYVNGIIQYDNRKRNKQIQNETDFAKNKILEIIKSIEKPNKPLILEQDFSGNKISISSNYQRELLFNLEHCIHHQALIKVALLTFDTNTVSETFGIANSTLQYRKQCAQ
jgi:hypothetical protein